MRLPALQSRNFRTYVFGTFFSLHGLWIQRIVVGWLGWELTGSATWVGILSFLLFAPTIVSGPLFGVVADRVDVRFAALCTQSLQFGLSLAMLILHIAGLTSIWSLAVLSMLIGTVTSAHHPLRMTMAPRLVDENALGNAVAITSVNFNFARLFGPAIGGVVIATYGAENRDDSYGALLPAVSLRTDAHPVETAFRPMRALTDRFWNSWRKAHCSRSGIRSCGPPC